MRKIIVFLFALVLMSNSDCADHTTYENDLVTYKVLEKGSQVGSHWNPFHKDNFEVSTDYFITLQNVETKKVFIYQTRSGEEYYQFQVGKRYKMRRLHNDWDRRK